MTALRLSRTDDGVVAQVGVGDVVEIRLAENPSTGFTWAIEPLPPMVRLEDTAFQAPPDAAIGTGGTRLARFRVAASGQATIRLKHWRDWEGDASVTERFSVTLRVSAA
ncbi:MAG TPA: protease inhibitor I42 family protein [Chloroflexota bacterium]